MNSSSQAGFFKSTGESMLLIATLSASLNLQDNIADTAALIRQKVKYGHKASQFTSGTPLLRRQQTQVDKSCIECVP